MILYNTTFFAEAALEDELVAFIKEQYLPESERHGMTEGRVARIRSAQGDDDGMLRLAVHLLAPDTATFERYCGQVQPALLEAALAKWGERVLAMPTAMDIL